jgi:hypothetical protein
MYEKLSAKELLRKRNTNLIMVKNCEKVLEDRSRILIEKWDKIFNYVGNDAYRKRYQLQIKVENYYIVFWWGDCWCGEYETLTPNEGFYGGSITLENEKYYKGSMCLKLKELDDPVRTIEKWMYEKNLYDENEKVKAFIENELEEIETQKLEKDYYLRLKNKYEKGDKNE